MAGRRPSSREDEMTFADRAKAKAKQAAGAVIGDDQLRRQGSEDERAAEQGRASATEGRSEMSTDPVGRGSDSPVSNTVHNLVQTLSVKLDSAYRYGLYRDDAISEGHEDCAQVFDDIAERERETIHRLVRCLQDRIGEAGAGRTSMGAVHEAAPGVGATEEPAVPLEPEPGAAATEPLEPGPATDVAPSSPRGARAEPRGPESPRSP